MEPLQVHHLRRHDHPAFVAIGRRQELKVHVECAGALGHIDMESVHVDRIPHPIQAIAAGTNDETGQTFHPGGGRMISRYPFRKQQRYGARVLHGDGLADPEDPALHVRGIHTQPDQPGIRDVARLPANGLYRRRGQRWLAQPQCYSSENGCEIRTHISLRLRLKICSPRDCCQGKSPHRPLQWSRA